MAPFTYEFPRPTVTVDAAVLRPAGNDLEILLIRRGHEPFAGHYALPGGFLEMDEAPLTGACRELAEETTLSGLPLAPLFACAQPGRDPRARCITLVYGALVSGEELQATGRDDAAEAGWHPFSAPLDLAFDHERVRQEIRQQLQWQARVALIGRNCLPEEFSPEALRHVHQLVLGEGGEDDPLDRGRRLGLLEAGRRPGFWRFRPNPPGMPDWAPMPW